MVNRNDNNQFLFPTLLVDDSVYALTVQGRIVSVFQIYEDAVNTLSSVRKDHPDLLTDIIVRIPVTSNLDNNRINLSPQDQQQLINNAHQLTVNDQLDAFNRRNLEQERDNDYQALYSSVRSDWRHIAWSLWLLACSMIAGIIMATQLDWLKSVVDWVVSGLGIFAVLSIWGGTVFADYRARKVVNDLQTQNQD